MPLVGWIREKLRLMEEEQFRRYRDQEIAIIRDRQSRLSREESRRNEACREIAAWLKEADSSNWHSDDYYFFQARERITGFRWQLYRFNRPFIWLEKKIIEPLDDWSKRANVFQFFDRISPLLEAIGVLAIPVVIFLFEIQREERQIKFEERIIKNQAEVRQQQAVREYLSQITTIYLDAKNQDVIRKNEDLRKLLRATTLAIFDELSVDEDVRDKSDSKESDFGINEGDRRGEVVNFLSELGWINGNNEDDEPLISLSSSDLSRANLGGASLFRADLRKADLIGANLRNASLFQANLRKADLRKANLIGANLNEADLGGGKRIPHLGIYDGAANLIGADLSFADLRKANLEGVLLNEADLEEADLEGADLYGAYLKGAILCRTIMPDGSMNNKDCDS